MLCNISKILTGDMLKALSDMGHGDVLVIADANFPGEALAKTTTYGKLIRCPGISVSDFYRAIHTLFPLDVDYSNGSAFVMAITDEDKAKGKTSPPAWTDFENILHEDYAQEELGQIERFEFYERAKRAYVIIQTGEERQYGNLLLVKGCVL